MVMSDQDPDTLKVIDFGVSRIQDEPRYYGRIGTPSIRAPEVTLGLLCTTAIDMWSLGCCLIELLIGKPAFQGHDEMDQLEHTIQILGMPPAELVASALQRDDFFDKAGKLRHSKCHMSREKSVLPVLKRLGDLLGNRNPDLLDFIRLCLHWDSSKRMTPSQALDHPWIKKTSLGCVAPSPGDSSRTVMLKSLETTVQRLEPAKATGSQPQTTDQGEKAKLGNKGRILRPLNLESDSLLPPIGAIRPAPPPRYKRATVTPGGGADERDTGATRPASQAGYSRFPSFGTAAPAPPPRGKRATVTTDDEEGKLKRIMLEKLPPGPIILPDFNRPGSDLGPTTPDVLDFVRRYLDFQTTKEMTPGTALDHASMTNTLLRRVAPSPGNPPKTDGGASKGVAVTSRPAHQSRRTLLSPISAAAPAPPPRGKRATVTPVVGAGKRDAGATRPAGQAACSRFPPKMDTGAASPAPPSRGKRAIAPTDGGAATSDGGRSRPADRRYSPFSLPLV